MTDSIPPGNSDTAWHTVALAARHLGIAERTVRARIAAGTLRAQRDGSRWLVELPMPIGNDAAVAETDADAAETGTRRHSAATMPRQAADAAQRHAEIAGMPLGGIPNDPGQQLAIIVEQVRAPLATKIDELETLAFGRVELRRWLAMSLALSLVLLVALAYVFLTINFR